MTFLILIKLGCSGHSSSIAGHAAAKALAAERFLNNEKSGMHAALGYGVAAIRKVLSAVTAGTSKGKGAACFKHVSAQELMGHMHREGFGVKKIGSAIGRSTDTAKVCFECIHTSNYMKLFQTEDTKEHGEAWGKNGRNTGFWSKEHGTAYHGQPTHRR